MKPIWVLSENTLSLLRIDGLRAFYGHAEVLHSVSLTVNEGELVSIIGPNGAGKTTILRAISRLIRTEGSIQFDGHELDRDNPRDVVKLGVAQSPEGRQLFPDMTVQDNLELGAFLRRNLAEISRDLERIFDLFPVLKERRRQRAGTMSGGEQQMVAIGRALMSKPRILLLDEPSFGIAPLIVDRIFSVVRELNKEGLTALIVEQNVVVALEATDRSYVLEGGRIRMEGRSSDLSNNEQIRETYLGL